MAGLFAPGNDSAAGASGQRRRIEPTG